MTKVEATKTLAGVFRSLTSFDARMDDIAGRVFAVVSAAKLNTLEAFNDAVRAAFEANGWHTSVGRPTDKATSKPVPRTVRSYVWEFRVAYRMGIKVTTMKSLYELRQAVLKAREKAKRSTPANEPIYEALKGVTVSATDKLLGVPFHDAIAVYQHLPPADQDQFLIQINRLVNRYKRQVEGTLRLVPQQATG